MSTEYERIVTQITIKPKGEPIFHELATTIRIEDEAAGPFLSVFQVRDDRRPGVTVDIESWDALKAGIDEMIRECITMELGVKA